MKLCAMIMLKWIAAAEAQDSFATFIDFNATFVKTPFVATNQNDFLLSKIPKEPSTVEDQAIGMFFVVISFLFLTEKEQT